MRTGTDFISEISAAIIFTSFNFHIFRCSTFRCSGKGEVDVYRMCMCLCFIVSIPCHGIRSSRHQGVSPQETITPPTNSPPNKAFEVNQLFNKDRKAHYAIGQLLLPMETRILRSIAMIHTTRNLRKVPECLSFSDMYKLRQQLERKEYFFF